MCDRYKNVIQAALASLQLHKVSFKTLATEWYRLGYEQMWKREEGFEIITKLTN